MCVALRRDCRRRLLAVPPTVPIFFNPMEYGAMQPPYIVPLAFPGYGLAGYGDGGRVPHPFQWMAPASATAVIASSASAAAPPMLPTYSVHGPQYPYMHGSLVVASSAHSQRTAAVAAGVSSPVQAAATSGVTDSTNATSIAVSAGQSIACSAGTPPLPMAARADTSDSCGTSSSAPVKRGGRGGSKQPYIKVNPSAAVAGEVQPSKLPPHTRVSSPNATGPPHYKCRYCDYSSDSANLLRHEVRAHSRADQPRACHVCAAKILAPGQVLDTPLPPPPARVTTAHFLARGLGVAPHC